MGKWNNMETRGFRVNGDLDLLFELGRRKLTFVEKAEIEKFG